MRLRKKARPRAACQGNHRRRRREAVAPASCARHPSAGRPALLPTLDDKQLIRVPLLRRVLPDCQRDNAAGKLRQRANRRLRAARGRIQRPPAYNAGDRAIHRHKKRRARFGHVGLLG